MENLKIFRINSKITQEVMANYIGCKRPHYALMETGDRSPHNHHQNILLILDKYAKAFDPTRLENMPMPIVPDRKFNFILRKKKIDLEKINLKLHQVNTKIYRERSFLLYTEDMCAEKLVVDRLEHTLEVRRSKERLDDLLLKYQHLMFKKVALDASISALEKYVERE